MASIQKSSSLLIEETIDNEEIPQEETFLNFNFYKDESIPDRLTQEDKVKFKLANDIEKKVSEETDKQVKQVNKEEEEELEVVEQEQQIEEKVDQQAEQQAVIDQQADQQAEQQAEQQALIDQESKRARTPSKIVKENEEQRLQKEQERKDLQEAKERLKLKKSKETPQDLDISNLSQVSELGDQSGDTSAGKIIIDNIRLETYNATSQATAIYRDELTNLTKENSTCALCGFELKDRVSYWHNKIHNPDDLGKLTWSYDHFVPVNFTAVMFRIVTSQGNYDDKELEILKDNGYIVCYHCNYEKSQRLFVTCKKTDGKPDFNNFEPNKKTITKFVNDLYVSRNKHGWADEYGNRTLIKCLAPPKYYKTWIRERIAAITTLAEKVCVNIISQVDFKAVEERLKTTKLIIRKAKTSVLTDERYTALGTNQKSKNRFKREYIARLFAAAELNFRSPWKWKQNTVISSAAATDAPITRAFSPKRAKNVTNVQDTSMSRSTSPHRVRNVTNPANVKDTSMSPPPQRVTRVITNSPYNTRRGNVAPLRGRQQRNDSLNKSFDPNLTNRSRSRSRNAGSRRRRKTYRRIRLF